MSCAHGLAATDFETAFSVDASAITFGHGALAELGDHARSLGMARVALFTDPRVRALPFFDTAHRSLLAAGLDVGVFDEVKVEPTDASFLAAADFARQGRFDGHVSLGGGSVIDTCKAASLYATYPAPFLAYVNAPIGEARPVLGPLPRTSRAPPPPAPAARPPRSPSATSSLSPPRQASCQSASAPTLALIDPSCTATLPASVRPPPASTCSVMRWSPSRPAPLHRAPPPRLARVLRPGSQGRNLWSDLGSLESSASAAAIVRAVTDASDAEAREALSWAATLAGIAFGNAGVHLPHAMAYAVAAGLVRDFRMPGYPDHEPMVPHGVSVIVNAPSVFRWTFEACPERHLGSRRRPRRRGPRSPRRRFARALADRAELMRRPPSPTASPESATPRPISTLSPTGPLSRSAFVDNALRPTSRGDDLRASSPAPSTPSELHQENAHGPRAPQASLVLQALLHHRDPMDGQ
ncbi:MAG: iron-containing alcohol dehydrogenase [Polyangiaceae bacterium]